MSLLETKKLLNFDQQNVLTCTVVQDFDTYTTIRTPDGKVVRADKSSGRQHVAGTAVEVRTDKRVYTIVGDSQYADYAAERSLEL